MLRRPIWANNNQAVFIVSGGGGATPTVLNPNTTPSPGTSVDIAVTGSGLIATGPSSTYGHACSLGSASTGLVHVEVKPLVLPSTDKLSIGVCNSSKVLGPGVQSWIGGTDHNSIGVYDGGGVWDITGSATNDSNLIMTVNVPIAVEIDFGNALAYFMQGAYRSPGYTIPAGALYLFIGLDNSTVSAQAKFGPTWDITPTTGYTGIMS